MNIGKKATDRIKANLPKYQKVLALAMSKDLNESDTVSIINDMLDVVFGYEKYTEISSELRINGTYCDLAIKLDDKYENGFLIECKRIGCELKEEHARQAVHYGTDKGISWVVLTNGRHWRLYHLRFEKPVVTDLVFDIDVTTISMRDEKEFEKLACLTKEGVQKGIRASLYEKVQCMNKYVVGQIVLNEPVMKLIRTELHKLSGGLVEADELRRIVEDEVLKRDVLDEDNRECKEAVQRVARFYRKISKNTVSADARPKPVSATPSATPSSSMSITEQLLAEVSSAGDTNANPPPATNG